MRINDIKTSKIKSKASKICPNLNPMAPREPQTNISLKQLTEIEAYLLDEI